MKGSVNVPLFVEDSDGSVSGALKQAVAYGTGGFWLGAKHMKANASFLDDVRALVPPATPVVVACQKGLRSISACEQLVRRPTRRETWRTMSASGRLCGWTHPARCCAAGARRL